MEIYLCTRRHFRALQTRSFFAVTLRRCAESIDFHPATSEQARAKRYSDDLTTAISVDVTYGKSDMSTDRDCWHHSIAR